MLQSSPRRVRGLVGTGLLAAVVAALASTLLSALARPMGVDFEIPDGGEVIPLSGVTVVTATFSVVGVLLAVALLRWSAHPATRFLQTTVVLTTMSLVPPFISGANAATVTALVAMHLVAAAVVIPTLTRGLRARQHV